MAEDVTELPAWAQRRISVAERNAEHWKVQAGVVAGGIAGAETFWTQGLRHEGTVIPNHSTVYFRLANKQLIYARVKGDLLMLAGEHPIIISPEASNMVKIASTKYLRDGEGEWWV